MYFDQTRHIRDYEIGLGGVMKDPLASAYTPVRGSLHQYQVAGRDAFYLEASAIPSNLMGARSEYIFVLDMVEGKPLVPVTAKWASNGICSLGVEAGGYTCGREMNAGHQIIAKVQVGPVEYVLGERSGKFPGFVTWERTPGNDEDGPPNYYWGHHFDHRDEAVRDFCGRASEKYAMLAGSASPPSRPNLRQSLSPVINPPQNRGNVR